MAKPKIATASLAGCFGCHMSLLDIDERILELVELIEFDKSPIDDKKEFDGPVEVGLIEGGCCNEENVRVLQDFREHCGTLISVGDCATMGGIPAMRNNIPLSECFDEAYRNGPTVYNPSGRLPNDPEIPLLLDRVWEAVSSPPVKGIRRFTAWGSFPFLLVWCFLDGSCSSRSQTQLMRWPIAPSEPWQKAVSSTWQLRKRVE